MRLLRRADFNAGANINTFWRMPCRGALDGSSKKALTWDNKHITWFGKSRVQRPRNELVVTFRDRELKKYLFILFYYFAKAF